MKISIALATYNGEKYIEAQIQSILDQTMLPDELVISDDNSTDNTINIINSISRKFPFETKVIINKKRLGYTQNFNSAILNTTGDIVLLCDQDDYWFKEKIEYIYKYAHKNNDALLIMNDAIITDENLNTEGLTKLGQIKSAGYNTDRFVMGCCCSVKRKILDICMPIPKEFFGHDDWIVTFATALNSKSITEKPLQYYRIQNSNTSSFIVNTTIKINKKIMYMYKLKKIALIAINPKKQHIDEYSRLNSLLNKINNFLEKNEDVFINEIQKFKKTIEDELTFYSYRKKIREKKIICRLISVYIFFRRKKYKYNTNMLIDIFGLK